MLKRMMGRFDISNNLLSAIVWILIVVLIVLCGIWFWLEFARYAPTTTTTTTTPAPTVPQLGDYPNNLKLSNILIYGNLNFTTTTPTETDTISQGDAGANIDAGTSLLDFFELSMAGLNDPNLDTLEEVVTQTRPSHLPTGATFDFPNDSWYSYFTVNNASDSILTIVHSKSASKAWCIAGTLDNSENVEIVFVLSAVSQDPPPTSLNLGNPSYKTFDVEPLYLINKFVTHNQVASSSNLVSGGNTSTSGQTFYTPPTLFEGDDWDGNGVLVAYIRQFA